MSCPGDNYVVPGANPCGGGGGGGVQSVIGGTNINIAGTSTNPIINSTPDGVTSINGIGGNAGAVTIASDGSLVITTPTSAEISIVAPPTPVAQFYKSVLQAAPSGQTTITFNSAQSWNSGSYITRTSSTDFTVVTRGVYLLELSLNVVNDTATWTAQRSGNINLNRGGSTAILQQTVSPPSGFGYTIQVVGTFQLEIGDVINCIHGGTNTNSGVVNIQPKVGSFDLNTSFTWTLVKVL